MDKTREDVVVIGRKLEKIISSRDTSGSTQALDLLKTLETLPVSNELLQKAHIIMSVNNLKKFISDKDVITQSKKLLMSWRARQPYNRDTNNKVINGERSDKRLAATNKGNNNYLSNSHLQKPATQPNETPTDTKNLVRLYCREILEKALSFDTACQCCVEAYANPKELAREIETFIFKEFKDTKDKYKNRVRSRASNLRDVKNPELKIKVLSREISAQQIAAMSYEDMASEEMKQLRARYAYENFIDNQLPVPTGIVSDLLKCPRCKRNNCAYNQVQILRADEPMTTFCYCAECGHHWKF